MSDEIPEWALGRVNELTGERFAPHDVRALYNAFARYIAEHEEPPADPLLIEARSIAARQPGLNALQQEALRNGEWDAASTVPVALAALKRGIEIAESRK